MDDRQAIFRVRAAAQGPDEASSEHSSNSGEEHLQNNEIRPAIKASSSARELPAGVLQAKGHFGLGVHKKLPRTREALSRLGLQRAGQAERVERTAFGNSGLLLLQRGKRDLHRLLRHEHREPRRRIYHEREPALGKEDRQPHQRRRRVRLRAEPAELPVREALGQVLPGTNRRGQLRRRELHRPGRTRLGEHPSLQDQPGLQVLPVRRAHLRQAAQGARHGHRLRREQAADLHLRERLQVLHRRPQQQQLRLGGGRERGGVHELVLRQEKRAGFPHQRDRDGQRLPHQLNQPDHRQHDPDAHDEHDSGAGNPPVQALPVHGDEQGRHLDFGPGDAGEGEVHKGVQLLRGQRRDPRRALQRGEQRVDHGRPARKNHDLVPQTGREHLRLGRAQGRHHAAQLRPVQPGIDERREGQENHFLEAPRKVDQRRSRQLRKKRDQTIERPSRHVEAPKK